MKAAKSYVDNKLKVPKSFFEWCFSQIPVYKWTNKERVIISSERKNAEIIEKRLIKSSNLNFEMPFKTFAIILVTSKRIEIQTYAFWSQIINGKESIDYSLSNLEVYSENEHIKVTEQYGSCLFGLSSNFGGMSGPYYGTKFYPNNYLEKIKTISELKYIDFSDFEFERWMLERLYKYRMELEFCQKIKANRLFYDILSGIDADMRTIDMTWLKENKSSFKNSDRSFSTYELEQRIKKKNGKLVPGIQKYLKYSDITHIPKGVGIIKFQNWIIKNEVSFSYYKDYLMLLKDLEINPVADHNLICPKDLIKAHDNCVDLLNQLKLEKKMKENADKQKEYEKQIKKRKKLEKIIDGYLFKVPDELNDLIIEGKTLHHCVGGSSYVEKHREGEITIIFVRDPKNIKKPLYTLEYKQGRIAQIRGKRNASAPNEVERAAEHWLKVVNA